MAALFLPSVSSYKLLHYVETLNESRRKPASHCLWMFLLSDLGASEWGKCQRSCSVFPVKLDVGGLHLRRTLEKACLVATFSLFGFTSWLLQLLECMTATRGSSSWDKSWYSDVFLWSWISCSDSTKHLVLPMLVGHSTMYPP